MSEKNKHDLVITRIFNAHRELVWKAWTDQKHIEQWWGPHGFTNPLCEWDARPGVKILVHMRGPKDTPFDMIMPMKGMFHEVTPPARLVFSTIAIEDANGNPLLETLNTATFEDLGSKTRFTMHVVVIKTSPQAAGPIAGMERGWTQSLEKLDTHIETFA